MIRALVLLASLGSWDSRHWPTAGGSSADISDGVLTAAAVGSCSGGTGVIVDVNGIQGCYRTSDTAPNQLILHPEDGYALGTQTPARLGIRAGFDEKKIVIDDYTLCAGDVITFTIWVTNNTATITKTFTEGVDFTAATSNAVTATNLAAALTSYGLYMTGTASSATVGVIPGGSNATKLLVLDVASSSDCLTEYTDTDAFVRVGSKTTFFKVVALNGGFTLENSESITNAVNHQLALTCAGGTAEDFIVDCGTTTNVVTLSSSTGAAFTVTPALTLSSTLNLASAETITNGTNGRVDIAGVGQTNNEDFRLDLETNANKWTLTSNTGVTDFLMPGITVDGSGIKNSSGTLYMYDDVYSVGASEDIITTMTTNTATLTTTSGLTLYDTSALPVKEVLASSALSIANLATTFAVTRNMHVVTQTIASSITTITGGSLGYCVKLTFTNAGTTLVDDGDTPTTDELALNGNFVSTANDSIVLCHNGTNWWEESRGVN